MKIKLTQKKMKKLILINILNNDLLFMEISFNKIFFTQSSIHKQLKLIFFHILFIFHLLVIFF